MDRRLLHRPCPSVPAWVAATWLLILSGGCAPESPGPRTVGVSLSPVASLVSEVTGDRIPVRPLLPPGRSPHDFEPSPSELTAFRGAILWVSVDPRVDGWMERSATAATGDRAPMMTIAETVSAETRDPHLWLDLDAVRKFLPALAERLASLDPEDASGYRARAQAVLVRLEAMDREARDTLAPVRSVPFALLHPAFVAMCHEFELNLIGVLDPHPEGEVRPRSLGEVTRQLRDAGVAVVFAEPQLDSRLATAVAEELGGRVAMLDPLGGPDLPGRDSYFELLQWNIAQLAGELR